MPKASTRIHVVPRNGGWAVRREGADRATSVHNSKKDAVERATDLAKKNSSRLIVHKQDGTIEKHRKP